MFNLAALPEDLVTKALTFLSVQSLCLIRAVNPCYRQVYFEKYNMFLRDLKHNEKEI